MLILKKKISWMLICTIIFLSFSNIGIAFASDEESNFTKEFLNATDDTIVCYMEGIPITKSQIDKNGFIDEETIAQIEQIKNKEISMYATSNTRTIPSGYNQAIVRSVISAPGYGQTNTQYYFTNSNGAKFASGLEVKNWQTILATAAGFIKIVGPTITIVFTANALYKSSVASKVRSYTDSGKKVHITEAKSKYGTFYGVFGWTNRVIETHKNFSGDTVESLTHLQYNK